ncbi:TPA: rod shape-determining protein MreC, partial [Stenotrophomonas maltophilia]
RLQLEDTAPGGPANAATVPVPAIPAAAPADTRAGQPSAPAVTPASSTAPDPQPATGPAAAAEVQR